MWRCPPFDNEDYDENMGCLSVVVDVPSDVTGKE
jgi:hypothetical protein